VQSAAAKRQLLCREAFHYKEHPANKAVAALLQVRGGGASCKAAAATAAVTAGQPMGVAFLGGISNKSVMLEAVAALLHG
jgi:hypothetical protein